MDPNRPLLGALTVRGVATALLAMLAVGTGLWWKYWVLTGVGAALALLVVVETIAVSVAPQVRAYRTVSPEVVTRFGTCTARLVVTRGQARWPVRMAATEQIGTDRLEVTLPAETGPERQVEAEYAIPTPRRGVITIGPLVLRRYGLTGMAARVTRVGAPVEVRVLPRKLAVHHLPGGARRAQIGADERVESGGTDLIGLHEYVPGDDLRRLHWASSAKTGALMVRDDADPAEPHLLVLLDDRVGSYTDPDDFEDAVEVASALCGAGVGAGRPVHLQTASGRADVEVGASRGGRPGEGAGELALLFSEIDLSEAHQLARLATRDQDVVVSVTGDAGRPAELALASAGAPSSSVLVIDPEPRMPVGSIRATSVLRAGHAADLVAVWDRVVGSPS